LKDIWIFVFCLQLSTSVTSAVLNIHIQGFQYDIGFHFSRV
jgi:hypothetical protein